MAFGITNFENLPWAFKVALEDAEAQIQAWLSKEHNLDGTHKNASAQVDPDLAPDEAVQESHRWLRGPWTFGKAGVRSGNIDVHLPALAGGTYHDYAPSGIDNAMIIEMNPDGSPLVFTGLRQYTNIKRLMVIGNYEAGAHTITLKHENTGSTASNRFSLPGSTDVVLAAGQYVWLYYDIVKQRWRTLVTTQQSGGLSVGVVKTAELDLDYTDVQSLNSTPVTIVAAPGSGLVAVPVSWQMEQRIGSTTFNTAPSFRARYNGTTVQLMNFLSVINSADVVKYQNATALGATQANGDDPSNTAIEVYTTADVTSGSGSWRLTMAYYLATNI